MIAPACRRDLRCVREMADPRLDHLDACLRQPLLDLLTEMVGDCLRVPPQRQLRIVVHVVGIAGHHVAKRRLALHMDVVLVIIHLEDGFGGVHHPPDHDGGDLDRVAIEVVHLQPGALEVPDAHRHAPLREKRVGKSQSGPACGADLLAEQLQDLGLVRVHHEETGREHHLHGECHEC